MVWKNVACIAARRKNPDSVKHKLKWKAVEWPPFLLHHSWEKPWAITTLSSPKPPHRDAVVWVFCASPAWKHVTLLRRCWASCRNHAMPTICRLKMPTAARWIRALRCGSPARTPLPVKTCWSYRATAARWSSTCCWNVFWCYRAYVSPTRGSSPSARSSTISSTWRKLRRLPTWLTPAPSRRPAPR